MDALKFLKNRIRMCNTCYDLEQECKLCEAYLPERKNNQCLIYSRSLTDFSEAVSMVEEWTKEHPEKTRLQDFFSKFPCAIKNSDGTPFNTRCCEIGYTKECTNKKSCYPGNDQFRECWNKPVED